MFLLRERETDKCGHGDGNHVGLFGTLLLCKYPKNSMY
jgi:hypothetical protein